MSQSDGSLDPRAGGANPPIVIPQTSYAVDLTLRIIRTIFFCGLFIVICKLTHFRQKILYDVRINRKFLFMFYLFASTFSLIYLYLLIKLRLIRPANRRIPVEKWDRVQPIPFYICTGCLVCCVISFVFALWSTFHFMTFIIGVVGFLSMIFLLQWLPI